MISSIHPAHRGSVNRFRTLSGDRAGETSAFIHARVLMEAVPNSDHNS